ncbi:MAG: Fis family transcriptional regulator [Algicola sp.]|nr:Fis family transcriptional regulator [Algicola sp.]
MKKSDKKIENTLRIALTQACEQALHEVDGFKWLTHKICHSDYSQGSFPASLSVECTFDTNEAWLGAQLSGQDALLRQLITTKLANFGIDIKTPQKQVRFVTLERMN